VASEEKKASTNVELEVLLGGGGNVGGVGAVQLAGGGHLAAHELGRRKRNYKSFFKCVTT